MNEFEAVPNQSTAEREAFELGSADKLKGYKEDANPYPVGRKNLEWKRGYILTTKIEDD